MSRRGDEGLTLVEVLVAGALSAVIAPVLTGALVIGWRTSADTLDRLAETRNHQLLPSQFTRDVQSATTLDTAVGSTWCRLASDPPAPLLQLVETRPAVPGPDVTQSVAWVLAAGNLERRTCAGGSTTVLSSVTLAHDVTAAARCRTGYDAAPTACSPGSRIVELVVTEAAGSFTVTAERRPT